MSKCLITKLQENVLNDSLMMLGEQRFEIESANGHIYFFIDISVPLTENIIIKVISGDLTFKPAFDTSINSYITEYNVKSKGYYNGYLYLKGSGVISVVSKYYISPYVFSNVKMKGDSSLWKYTKKDKTQYVEIIGNSNFTVYLEDLADFTNLKTINCSSATAPYTNVKGDASSLPSKCESLNTANQSVSWKTNRPSSYVTVAAQFVDFGEYLDAYLINQALCADGSAKSIIVTGVKTEASDNAVATLIERGYSIRVNGVQL